MKIVYIAGPYMANSHRGIEKNIAAARDAAIEVAEMGAGFICPHLNSAHFELFTPRINESFWKALDMRLLQHCDAVYMLENWGLSSGAKAEHEYAIAQGIKVIYQSAGSLSELREWAHE